MPWKETTTMDQKVEFICEWRTGKYTITELCKNFGISRPTAYRVIDRFEKQGYEGLREQSRTPRKHPNETSQEVIEKILKLKENINAGEQKRSEFYCLTILQKPIFHRWLLCIIY
jgi:transposase